MLPGSSFCHQNLQTGGVCVCVCVCLFVKTCLFVSKIVFNRCLLLLPCPPIPTLFPYDIMIYLLTAIGLSPGAVVQYTFTHKQYTERYETNNTQNNTTILEECWPCPVLASYTLTFSLQPMKKHGKTSVRVAASKNTQTTISIHRQQ